MSGPNDCLDMLDVEEFELSQTVARLENWSIFFDNASPYASPEQQHDHLQGNVYSHPMFPDGEFIKTSRIVGRDIKTRLIHTRHTHYELGAPDPDYEAKYPNALTRAFAAITGER